MLKSWVNSIALMIALVVPVTSMAQPDAFKQIAAGIWFRDSVNGCNHVIIEIRLRNRASVSALLASYAL